MYQASSPRSNPDLSLSVNIFLVKRYHKQIDRSVRSACFQESHVGLLDMYIYKSSKIRDEILKTSLLQINSLSKPVKISLELWKHVLASRFEMISRKQIDRSLKVHHRFFANCCNELSSVSLGNQSIYLQLHGLIFEISKLS